jgi:hypothetical protein
MITLAEHIRNEIKRNLELKRGLVAIDFAFGSVYMPIKSRDWLRKMGVLK